MIQQQKNINNKLVSVTYINTPECVNVLCQQSHTTLLFAGYAGLEDMFDAYVESFSNNTDLQTTVNFFKPNVQQILV